MDDPSKPVVDLEPIGPGDFDRMLHIRVAPRQEKFSGTIQQAFRLNEAQVDFHAICSGGRAVGFFKVDHGYSRTHAFAHLGEPGIRAFMIDRQMQGQGLATAAIQALPVYLRRQYPEAGSVVLTVNMINRAAVRAYRKGGFVDTGDIHEGGQAGAQLVMRMQLS
ncbi:MAG: GNAT family N-acetyltransferase [Arenibacterium sp.]